MVKLRESGRSGSQVCRINPSFDLGGLGTCVESVRNGDYGVLRSTVEDS